MNDIILTKLDGRREWEEEEDKTVLLRQITDTNYKKKGKDNTSR